MIAARECVAQTAVENRLALVIGNASYKNSPLANPVNDARLMEAALKESGFQVIKAENATIREMRRLVREFGERLKASGGVGLFYFAGHGVQVNGENFLVSVDSDIRHEDEVADDAVNAQVVLEKMQSAGNRMNLIVLDACRNNPYAVKSRSSMNGLATMNAPSGSMVAYATAPGSVASDGGGANGLYTQHLAHAIRQPGLPVEEVFKQVRTAVRRDSRNQQTPWENTALEGQFYFVQPPQPAATPVLAVVPQGIPRVSPPVGDSTSNAVRAELELWNSVKDNSDPSALQRYVRLYPSGTFADLAWARIAALQTAVATRAPSALEFLEQGAGKLLITDGYTGYTKAAFEVSVASRTANAIAYSTGDVLSQSGEVLSVRLGTYVGTVKSGGLWTLPLRNGASGSAQVTFDKIDGIGRFDWNVVRQDDRIARVEVDVYLPMGTNASVAFRGCLRNGSWNAQYRSDMPLPTSSKLSVSSSCLSSAGQERIVTEWQPKP